MELLKDLLFSGFVAVSLSLLLAKLVSVIIWSDHSPRCSAAEAPSVSSISNLDKVEMMDGGRSLTCETVETGDDKIEKVVVQQESESPPGEKVEDLLPEMTLATSIEEIEEKDISTPKEESAKIDDGVEEEKEEADVEIEEDWEGIERSESEKLFVEAAKFVASGKHETLASESVQLELYALNKVATEGPCRDLPPMPLKITARANWSAWHKLGNMTPEAAMEKYVAIVSERAPGWTNESDDAAKFIHESSDI